MRIMITGAAGNVGSVLTKTLEVMPEVTKIVGVDLKTRPYQLADCAKAAWIQADLSIDDWKTAARDHGIDAVVHLAFQIPQLYGRQKVIQRRWNLEVDLDPPTAPPPVAVVAQPEAHQL